MTADFDLIEQGRRMEWMTMQTRLRLLESELALGLTFCMVLETELRLGEVAAARGFLHKLKGMLKAVRRSIDDTGGLPAYQLNYLRQKLQSIEQRVRSVEVQLKRGITRRHLQLMRWPLPGEYSGDIPS
jgi:hypothetical protein